MNIKDKLVRDMARYIKYLENQQEHIANRDEMNSKKWWEGASEYEQANFINRVYAYLEGTADTWGPLGV